MSPAGLNQVARLIRFSYPADDVVGGAVPSGTVTNENLFIRIRSEEPTLALLEQGLQTPTIYTGLLFGGNIDITHNDQIEVTAPQNSWFYGKKFRVIGVQRSSNHPAQDRNQIRVTMRRYEEAHSNDIQ
jgi:hypothetical protein